MSRPCWTVRRVLAVAACVTAILAGTARPARAEPGDELTISVVTVGPGDHPFTKFGHDGILVEDARRGATFFYNYGTFAFDSIWLIPKFLLGKYQYWLSVAPFDPVIASYAADNRSLVLQRLALPAEDKRRLADFLAWNAREENKHYLYDYYRDNCATRVRDAIDRASGGALAQHATLPARMTWRAHTRRLTADDLLVYLGLDIAMGGFIDQRISVWEEMFLPAEVERTLRRVTVGTTAAVESEAVLFSASRPPPRTEPPAWTGRFFLVGCAAALLFVALSAGARAGRKSARILLGMATSVAGFVMGVLGCLFVFLWVFTNHEVAHRNENILQCAPFALWLTGYGIGVARGHAKAARRAAYVALLGAAASAVGLALKALPWFRQANGPWIALWLPLWLGITAAVWLVHRSGRAASAHDGHLAAEQKRRVE